MKKQTTFLTDACYESDLKKILDNLILEGHKIVTFSIVATIGFLYVYLIIYEKHIQENIDSHIMD